MKALFFALRPKQWAKNLFVFLPLVFGKKLFSWPENFQVVEGFVLFSMMASAVYLMNDLVDFEQDKIHRMKRLRPLASGKLSKELALLMSGCLCVVSTTLSFLLNPLFGWVVLSYFLFNFIYSKIIKNIVILDVFSLAIFFVLRVVGGTVIAHVRFSHWMIFMIVLLAMFLGFVKRRQECQLLGDKAAGHRFVLSKYSLYFIDQIMAVLTSTMIVVYMLYTVDSGTIAEFGTAHLVYTIPFVYYGIFRYLYLVHKRRLGDDPTYVLFFDKMTQINLIAWFCVCVLVIYFKI